MPTPTRIAASALVTCLVVACSSAPPDSSGEPRAPRENAGSAASAIQGGTDDTTHTFAVGVCGGTVGDCDLTCSGALIAPNLVVTARHCVDVSPQGINATCTAADGPDCHTCADAAFGARIMADTAYSITTDASMKQSASGWHPVAKIVTPAAKAMCGNDIALLILAENVPASEATPVTPAVQAPITDHATYSTAETAIGYGLTSPALQPDTSGLRRIRENIPIVCIPNDPKSYLDCYSIDPQYALIVTQNEFVVGDGTCEGDSGSSAFAQSSMTAGSPISLGVLSRGGTNDAGTQCIGGIYTRLDKWRDLLVSTVTTAAQAGGYPLPAWTAPIASDAGADTGADAAAANLGATCARDADCKSGLCASPPNAATTALVCTQACDSANVCPDGFACSSDPPGCFAGITPAPTTSQVQASGGVQAGCAIGFVGDPTNPLPWAHVGAAVAGLLALVRRRRAAARP